MIRLSIIPGADYEFEYTNHADETEMRLAKFIDMHFGAVEPYYPTPRILFHMSAYDRGGAYRSFDPTKINFETWRKI